MGKRMALPKGIATRQVGILVAFTVWMLFMSMLLFEVLGAKTPIGLLMIIIPVGFGPLIWYLFALRKRVRLAAQPHGEQLLELRTKERELTAANRGRAVNQAAQGAVLVLSVLFCIGLLGYQCYMYLRHGEWISKSWTDMGWPVPDTGWIGLQNILNWIAQVNAGVLVLIGGFVVSMGLGDDDPPVLLKKREVEALRKELKRKGVSVEDGD